MTAQEIKPQELRIGNLIQKKEYKSTWRIIAFWGTSMIEVDAGLVNFPTDDLHQCDISEFEPIPLSEDWLKRMGFENIDDEIDFSEWQNGWVLIYGNGSDRQEPFTYRYSVDENGDDVTVEVKYVHQLQNLIHALTGTELEITS